MATNPYSGPPPEFNGIKLRSSAFYQRPEQELVKMGEVKWMIDDIKSVIEALRSLNLGTISPLTTKGDIWIFDIDNTRLPYDTDGFILQGVAGLPEWVDPSILGFMTSLAVRENGAAVGSRTAINFVDGGGITWTITDDAGNGEVDIAATVSSSTPALTDSHIFVGNASNVATDVAMSGDATIANTGALTIANNAVTYAKIQDVSATDRLLGRVSAGSGDVEEVVLDTDGTLAADSDDIVATQKAVKTYVDSQFVFSKSSANQTTTSTSLVDITNVGVAIAANQNMYFKAFLKVGCSATNGARWAVTIPTGATMLLSHAGTSEATRALAAPQWLTTSGTEGSTTNAIINTNMWVVMEGWVYNGANAGTVQVQGRSVNVANTVTIYEGSMAHGTLI